jgi:hypothetical protein
MTTGLDSSDWARDFVLSHDLLAHDRKFELKQLARNEGAERLLRGVYLQRPGNERSTSETALLERVRAAHLVSGTPLIFGGLAAAVVWELPLRGTSKPPLVVCSKRATGGRSNVAVHRTQAGSPAPAEWRDGILVTTLARTVADVARTESFAQAVAICDAALAGLVAADGSLVRHQVSKEEILGALAAHGRGRGTAIARFVVDFSTELSGSPGESLSRCTMYKLGIPLPMLQVPFYDSFGLIGIVDFWWPQFNVIGEFDGLGKYLRDEFTRGRSIDEIVIAEKVREDRLRASSSRPTVVRWGWSMAGSPQRLGTHLAAAGIR